MTETFLPPDPPVERPHLAISKFWKNISIFNPYFLMIHLDYSLIFILTVLREFRIFSVFIPKTVFDAYKRREIMDVIDEFRDDVLAYGYFTTDNCETAQLIANSTFNYHKSPPTMCEANLFLFPTKKTICAFLLTFFNFQLRQIHFESGENQRISHFDGIENAGSELHEQEYGNGKNRMFGILSAGL